MASVNEVIGNYRLVKEVASGAFGRVYQGEHVILTNRVVAIKLLNGTHLNSQKDRDSFIQEARLLEMLKHPFILPIIDVGIHEGFPYLITEYASGGSLRNRLQRRSTGPSLEEEAITILSQIGQALHHAHEEHIIHRDLKPENILFNAKGEALLADFGIATVLSTLTINYNVTVIGTPAYMAPEQFRGAISKESDQYALGCIAYELFTGHRPFTAPDFASLMFKHLMENPLAPAQLNPSLPMHIEQAILKAMAKERAERHADVATFITALRLPDIVQTNQSTTTKTDTTIESPTQAPKASSASQKTKEQWLDEALAYHKAKQYTKALAAFNQAIQLDPEFVHAYIGKGNALYDLDHNEEALAAYEHAIRLNDNYVDAYNGRGNALKNLRRYTEALEAYNQAIRRDPENAYLWQSKGDTLKRLRWSGEAREAYERARQLGYHG